MDKVILHIHQQANKINHSKIAFIMIHNDKQLEVTKSRLQEFKDGLAQSHGLASIKDVHPILKKCMEDAMESTINTLEEEIAVYLRPKASAMNDVPFSETSEQYKKNAIEIANDLFKIHYHDVPSGTGKIIYYEDDILAVLKKWGLPDPDWDGNAAQMTKQ